MRLKKIKIAGFKSFVDPTTIELRSNLTGVVGPNGCGKSNTIDAVRWVMGESSARYLRGESMDDVIFTGSSARKPVSRASVELIFDNTDGSLGGQYAEYNEIAIKREVVRDGGSSYYLNGTRCRRRDVTDIFLGTGLGPRSYAIIEQGMISRLVEAKPEELRVFLEEAAGISKYKDRRRETENRMRHTRENLERLDDVREELTKQLDRLQRQARTAERYKELKTEERAAKNNFLALQWRDLSQEFEARAQTLREGEVKVEAAKTQLVDCETSVDELRVTHADAMDTASQIQTKFFQAGSEVTRIEQELRHRRDMAEQRAREMTQLNHAVTELGERAERDNATVRETDSVIAELEPAYERAQGSEEQQLELVTQAEEKAENTQGQWDKLVQARHEADQAVQIEQTKISHLERSLGQRLDRKSRLNSERSDIQVPEDDNEAIILTEQLETLEQRRETLEESLSELQESLQTHKQQAQAAADELHKHRNELNRAQGRAASLQALQDAALRDQSGEQKRWLQENDLDAKSRLAEELKVQDGWEVAVESALGDLLTALVLGDDDIPLPAFKTAMVISASAPPTSAFALPSASSIVEGELTGELGGLLAHVYIADNLAGARAHRAALPPGHFIVCKDGTLVGKSWLTTRASEDGIENSVLARKESLAELEQEITTLRERIDAQVEQVDSVKSAIAQAESQREEQQRSLNTTIREVAETKANLSGRRQQIDQIQQRALRLDQDIANVEMLIEQEQEEISLSRERLEGLLEQFETASIELEDLRTAREQSQNELRTLREQARVSRDSAHSLAVQLEALRTRRDSLTSGLEQLGQQLERSKAQLSYLQEQAEATPESDDDLNEQLQIQLELRDTVEVELKGARDRVAQIDATLRDKDQARNIAQQAMQKAEAERQKAELAARETAVRQQTVEEKLQQAEVEADALLKELTAENTVTEFSELIGELSGKIQRLGAINLAAIEEYKTEAERKDYLDRQHDDLTSALHTLETAIAKIDHETRSRFKETFQQVNDGMGELFPRLFGGGRAHLELTGQDLLDTGVTIMARPPGKRVSNIHLLSGGEKALTAIALVFAIFQLNPAPFCMLDEVDAPLDDANVGRFSQMVKSMSSTIQFIFITHNKVTMEIAEQMAGVTMREPGVSRMVSVDIAEAMELVDA